MRRVYYEETQHLRNSPWIFVLTIALTLGAMLPLLRGIHQQVGKNIPWGNEPMSDQGLLALTAFIFAISCGIVWIFAMMKLHVIIDEAGVHYRFVPNEPKWSTVTREEIIDFAIEKKNLFNGFGHHRQWFIHTKTMNLNGKVLLSLRLKNGKKIKLGSQNPEGLEWAMKKLIPQPEMS